MSSNYKVIFHLDLDAFFCSVEELKYPFLKGKPFAIGDERKERGIISTCSYEARKYKVKSAMSILDAIKLCPHLIMVHGDFQYYSYYSKSFFDILYQYTNNILVASIDEAYMDVTELVNDPNEYYILAKKIKKEVNDKLGLTVSIGIAPTVFMAKMASELNKPNGIAILRKRDFLKRIGDFDIKEVHGIGKKSCEKLYQINIYKIKELLYPENEKRIIETIGKNHFEDIRQKLNGNSSNQLDYDKYSIAQSIGSSHTFIKELEDFELIIEEFKSPIKTVIRRMKRDHRKAKTVSITIKYSNFNSIIRSKSLEYYTDSHSVIEHAVYELFEENWNENKVRLVGVTVSNFEDEFEESIEPEVEEEFNLFSLLETYDKKEYIEKVIEKINDQYEYPILFKGNVQQDSEEKK